MSNSIIEEQVSRQVAVDAAFSECKSLGDFLIWAWEDYLNGHILGHRNVRLAVDWARAGDCSEKEIEDFLTDEVRTNLMNEDTVEEVENWLEDEAGYFGFKEVAFFEPRHAFYEGVGSFLAKIGISTDEEFGYDTASSFCELEELLDEPADRELGRKMLEESLRKYKII